MNINLTDAGARCLLGACVLLFIFLLFCLAVLFVGDPDLLDAIRNAIYEDSRYIQEPAGK